MLVTVTDCVTASLTCLAGKVTVVDETLTLPCRPVAVRLPDGFPALVATLKVPERTPAAAGVNRMDVVQLLPAARVPPQVVETNWKSVPVTEPTAGAVTLTVPTPSLVSVAVPSVLAPTWVLANEGGGSATLGARPVPVRLAVVPPAPLCVKVSVLTRVPAAVGVNVTDTVQVAFTAKVPQVLVCAKSEPAVVSTFEMTRVFVPVFRTVTV